MRLSAKIKSNYLDDVLSGKKKCEFRQLEDFELVDENGRVAAFKIERINTLSDGQIHALKRKHKEIPWSKDTPIIRIDLGERLR
jgi:hypothetical protein